MRLQIVNTADRHWYSENQSVHWGFGFEVDHYAEWRDDADKQDMHLEPAGWSLAIMLGRWGAFLYSEDGWNFLHGPNAHREPKFEIVR